MPLNKSRRDLLVTTGSVALGGLAGCSEATEQSFEATPVGLPEADREELLLAGITHTSETVTREGPTGNLEVSITSAASVYRRGPALGGE